MISWLFGGSKTADKTLGIVDKSLTGIGNWIDGKDFTNQEKAEMHAKAVEAHLELVKATTSENSVRSITRRYLAWGITGFTLFWSSVAIGFAIAGKYEVVKAIIDIAAHFQLGMAFLAVMGFYFGVQLFRNK